MDPKEYFSEWISRTLWERNITGGDVAKALSVNDSAVSRWKSGKATPGLDSTMKLADFLGIDAIALAVTAGLMDPKIVNVDPLPLPEEPEDLELARKHIMKIPGLTLASRRRLLESLSSER